MNKPLSLLLALAVGAALGGCSNALNGAKQDAANNTQAARDAAAQTGQAVQAGAQKAGQAVAAAPQNAEANTVVRPAVKTAIIRDPVLAQSGNLINVNAGPLKITLTGHVVDASMKQRATEDAQVALKNHPNYTLTNELTVAGAGQ